MISDIFFELKQIEKEIKKLVSLHPHKDITSYSPPMDIVEKEGTIYIYLDLPGFKAKDIDLEVDGKQLIIKGTKRIDKTGDKGLNFICLERKFGKFERRIFLGHQPDIEKIDAVLFRGILKITIPLKENQKVKIKIREEE